MIFSNELHGTLGLFIDVFNKLGPRQNGRYFPDDIFKCIFLNKNEWISIKISLQFVPEGTINNIPPASGSFAQPLVQAQIKENIKAPRHWPLWGEWPVDSLTKGPLSGKCFRLMTSPWDAIYSIPSSITLTIVVLNSFSRKHKKHICIFYHFSKMIGRR